MKILTQLTGAMSGSMAGTTASRNRGGQYLRTRAIPTNPNSGRQNLVRGIFGSLAAGFRGLSDANRASWAVWADNSPITDTLGQSYTMTPLQAYISVNALHAQAEAFVGGDGTVYPLYSSAPALFGRAPSPVTVSIAIGTDVDLDGRLGEAMTGDGDFAVLLFVGRPVSDGVDFYRGPYRLAYASPDPTDQAGDEIAVALATGATSWETPYGQTVGVGSRVPVKVVVISANGNIGGPFFDIVTAASSV